MCGGVLRKEGANNKKTDEEGELMGWRMFI